mgnify:CR=1 FL=1
MRQYAKISACLIVCLVFTTLFVSTLVNQTALAQRTLTALARPKIRTMVILGTGIAVSTADASDFKIIKVGIARVLLPSVANKTEFAVGVFHLDNKPYKVRNINIGNGTVAGDLYRNKTIVGSISVNLVIKPGHDVWYGSITLDGVSYNVYIIEVHRPLRASEAAEKIESFCDRHPLKCRVLARVAKNRIKNYCIRNVRDSRCVELVRHYCKEHIEDFRCRNELKLFCVKNPTNEKCVEFCKKFPRACNPRIVPVSAEATTVAEATPTELAETEE